MLNYYHNSLDWHVYDASPSITILTGKPFQKGTYILKSTLQPFREGT